MGNRLCYNMPMIFVADSLDKMNTFALEFLDSLESGRRAVVVGLRGDLGSGKTTFVQNLARHLGVEDDVTSPTYVIQKSYDLPEGRKFKKLVHIDAYRLDAAEGLAKLGFSQLLKEAGTLIVVEWPEKVPGILPSHTKQLNFRFVNETVREITYGEE